MDSKPLEGAKGIDRQGIDPNQQDTITSPQQFYSPTLGDQMQSRGSFDFTDNDLGSSMIAGGGSTVYSPFFMQLPFPDKPVGDSMKNFSSSFSVEKTSGLLFCVSCDFRSSFLYEGRSSNHYAARQRNTIIKPGLHKPPFSHFGYQFRPFPMPGAAESHQSVPQAGGRVLLSAVPSDQTRRVVCA